MDHFFFGVLHLKYNVQYRARVIIASPSQSVSLKLEMGINKPLFRNQPDIILWFCMDAIFSVICAPSLSCSFSLFPSENLATTRKDRLQHHVLGICTSFLLVSDERLELFLM